MRCTIKWWIKRIFVPRWFDRWLFKKLEEARLEGYMQGKADGINVGQRSVIRQLTPPPIPKKKIVESIN